VPVQQILQPGSDIYWWRRIRSIDFPYAGRIVKVGPSLVTVSIADVAARGDEVVRRVSKARVQQVGGYCVRAAEQGPSLFDPMRTWGKFVRYIDVDADLRPRRQVDLFENSCLLRHDRTHWVDSYGILGDARVNRNKPVGPWGRSDEISALEFESVWEAAGKTDLWKLQLSTSRSAEMGQVPIWFARSGWQPPPLANKAK